MEAVLPVDTRSHLDAMAAVDTRSPEEVAAANAYADQHERMENFIFMYALPAQIFRRMGIEFHSGKGYSLLFVILFLTILLPGLLISALTGWPAELQGLELTTAAAVMALLNVLALIFAQEAAFKISALHRLLRDEERIRALMRWDRAWFGPKASAAVGGGIALALLVILYVLNLSVSGIRLHPTILWICGVVAVFLGQYSFSTALIYFEFRRLSTCRFELYRLSPYDTLALQITSTGLKQLGMVSSMFMPFFLLVLLLVLPAESDVNIPITGGFVLLSYVATAIGILFPLGYLGDIVKAEKWRMLKPLQAELNGLADKVRTMAPEDFDAFQRLHTFYVALRDTRDSYLSLGALARIGGALLIATFSVILTSVVESYIGGLR